MSIILMIYLELIDYFCFPFSQLISLYPFMLPSNNCFSRREPPLHEIADINQLAKGVKVKVYEFKAFLMAYLEEIRAGVKSSQYPHSEVCF